MKKEQKQDKRIKIHKRILRAFLAVLTLSFLVTIIVFDFGRQQMEFAEAAGILYQYGFYDMTPASTMRWIMLAFAGLIFVIAAVATFILSASITRPIEQLSEFAVNIGKGKFVQNELEFADEELHDLNNALNESIRQLEAFDKEQKTFFQNASHELRTPLMSIKCYAEGITQGIMPPQQAAKTILQETDKLTELVKELLYISQIDNLSKTHAKSVVDLGQIIKDCVHRQQAQAEKNNIKFSLDLAEGLVYKCVPMLMSRAIDNLISNALRYAKSEISLSLHLRGGYIGIKVADDGKGIADDILPHVFERFYKGEGGNTGIGLSIVKSIVQQHKGSVAVENSNTGAVFTIILPTLGN